jgi:hypothetical protein
VTPFTFGVSPWRRAIPSLFAASHLIFSKSGNSKAFARLTLSQNTRSLAAPLETVPPPGLSVPLPVPPPEAHGRHTRRFL